MTTLVLRIGRLCSSILMRYIVCEATFFEGSPSLLTTDSNISSVSWMGLFPSRVIKLFIPFILFLSTVSWEICATFRWFKLEERMVKGHFVLKYFKISRFSLDLFSVLKRIKWVSPASDVWPVFHKQQQVDLQNTTVLIVSLLVPDLLLWMAE